MYKIVVEIPGGWGVILMVKEKKIPRTGGGVDLNFFLWCGFDYFLDLPNDISKDHGFKDFPLKPRFSQASLSNY